MHTETFIREFAPLASGPGGVQKLREVMLNLAVSGRLSSQRQEDGTAEPLVHAAARAIKLAVKNGAVRKPRYFEKPASSDQEFRLPPNWVATTLGNLGLISPRNEAQEDTLSGFVPMAAIEAKYGLPHAFEQRQWGEIKSGYTHVANGDVVLAKITPCFENGKSTTVANLPNGIGAGTTELHVFRQLEPVVKPGYLLAFLKSGSFIETGIPKMTGTAGQKRIPADYFALTPFPLPPLPEQQRIVSKVDELMALCDTLEAQQAEEAGLKRAASASALHHLIDAKTPQQTANRWSHLALRFGDLFDDLETIKGLRECALTLAFDGKLVSQERGDETATQLLSRIRSRRAGKFKQKETEHRTTNLPEGWTSARFVEVGEFGRGRSRHRPRNDPSLYANGNIPLVQTGDVARANGVIRSFSTCYNETGLAQSRLWPSGTLCITIAANIADTAILGFDACFPDSVVGFIPDEEFEDARYFEYFMRTAKNRLNEFAPSTAQKNINLGILDKVAVPLPPLAEQKRIVAKVDELMAMCDRLEEQVREGERLNAELMASLVHALTETDPDGGGNVESVGLHEPAPELAATTQAKQETPQRPETKSTLIPLRHEPGLQAPLDRSLSVDTKFQEAVLVAAIVRTFFDAGGEPIGNFRLQKAVYFARRKMGENVGEMAYLKKAAGPYNPSMKYSGGIAISKQKNWLREARGRFGFGHVPGRNVGDAGEWIDTYGYGAPALWVAEHFRYKKNEEWETLATVDYAIEHLQAHGIEPDAAQILQYIASDSEWRPKIEKLGLTEMSVGTAVLEVQALFSAQREGDEA